MAMHSEDSLRHAWHALSGSEGADGWRIVPMEDSGATPVYAGRHFPGNAEGVLLLFDGARLPSAQSLPKGYGFEVASAQLSGALQGRPVLALVREPAGSLEMFVTMASDLLETLERTGNATSQERMQIFLRRVATWQEFMKHPSDGLLSAEAELGLIGELHALELTLDAGIQPSEAVKAWEGPEDGLHDFVMGSGAIEVKSTVAASGFPARIASLEQLDDVLHAPLFVCFQRFIPDPDAPTLFGHIDRLRERLEQTGAARAFNVRLMHARAFDKDRDAYTRRLSLGETTFFKVEGDFPRITPTIAGPGIKSGRYEIDAALVQLDPISLPDVLAEMETQ